MNFLLSLGLSLGLGLAIFAIRTIYYSLLNKRPPLAASDLIFEKEDLQKLIHTVISMQIRCGFRPSIMICPKAARRTAEILIRQSYGINDSIRCSITYDNLNGPPGKVRKTGFADYEIAIDRVYQLDDDVKVAVLAHEYAHIWLDLHGRNQQNSEHEERLADVAAVFLGGGLLILRAMQEKYDYNVDSITHSKRRLGYLSIKEVCYVIDAHGIWIENTVYLGDLECIPAVAKEAFKAIIEEAEVAPKIVSSNEHFLIIQCNKCFQQLRIPRKSELKIRCPVCKSENIVGQKRRGRLEFRNVNQ
jgi:predicted Zn-ribbon and HTH transcriptional regulator